jgi:Phenazine biosynthesis-like protein
LLVFNVNSRGVILCCEAPWYHETSSTADDSNNANGSSVSGDTNNTDISAAATPQADFQSRFFAPKAGIDEDPVTGSAHCVLAPHFFQRLHHKKSITKTTLIGHQQSPRGGFVECSMIYAETAASENAQEFNGDGPAQGEDGDEEGQRQQKQVASATITGDRVRITGTAVVTMVGELY